MKGSSYHTNEYGDVRPDEAPWGYWALVVIIGWPLLTASDAIRRVRRWFR